MTNNIVAILDSISFFGKERSNLEVYRLFEESNYNLSVIANRECNSDLFDSLSVFNPYYIRFTKRSKSVKGLVVYIFTLLISNIELFRVIKRLKPEILIIPTEKLFYDYFFVLCFIYRRKIIFRVGDSPIVSMNNNTFGSYLYSILWRRFVVKRIDWFVSISEFITRKLLNSSSSINRSCITRIYNYPPARDGNIPCCSLDRSEFFTIGYIGQIVPNKGVDYLIEAANILRNNQYSFRFVIAGDLSNTPYSKSLVDKIDYYGLSSYFTFLGKISATKSFYSSLDVLCVPSIYEEPLSNVVGEAKQMRKPSIVFNSGGLPELIRHGYDGYICENNTVDDLYQFISLYIKDGNVKIHGKNAYQSIVDRGLSYDNFKNRWISLIDQLLLQN